jgi:membrane-bound ClpP family serine protease
MESYELLVKLASFGTAGVCVLAIFLIGTSIMRLKADTPEWKVSLMHKFMNTCILIAIISAISGGANAYFNQNKIQTARNEAEQANERSEEATKAFTIMQENYNMAREDLVRYKADMNTQINTLERQLEARNIQPQSVEGLQRVKEQTNSFDLKTNEELLRGINMDKIKRIK